MSANIEKRGGNYRIRWVDPRGRRRSKTFKRKEDARAALRVKEAEVQAIASGRLRERGDQTVEEAAKEWLKSRKPSRRVENKRHLEHHIIPFMGDKRLPEVTPALVEKFIRHLETKKTARHGAKNEDGKTLKPGSINNVIITLRKMLNDLDYQLRIKFKVPQQSFEWLKTQAEVAAFLEEAGKSSEWFRVACEISVYSGLRKGEVAGLQWSDIDYEHAQIRVERQYDGEPTKGRKTRYVPLPPDLATTLKRWRMRKGGRLVVTTPDGPITRDTDLAKKTRRACKRAGVNQITFHELRDTCASHWVINGTPLYVVGALLGHEDPKTTQRYAHVDTGSASKDARVHLSFATENATIITMANA